MTDAEFVEELVVRLNLWLDGDPNRANRALLTPLSHAGYSNVGHFMSQLCFPRHGLAHPQDEIRFLVPTIEDQRITRFQALTGAELQARHEETAQKAAETMVSRPAPK